MAVLTTTGRQHIADKLRATGGAAVGLVQASPNDTMKFVGWGTGATAEAIGNTALATAAPEARVSGAMTSPSAAVFQVVATIVSAGTQTITEVGLFDQLAAGGTMAVRALFTGIPLLAADSISFTISVTII
ncbi:MAG: hypothetical protein ABIW46_08625 [Acidimicrobiales bacterium]